MVKLMIIKQQNYKHIILFYTVIQILNKHVGNFGCVFHWVGLGVCYELSSESAQFSHCNLSAQLDV